MWEQAALMAARTRLARATRPTLVAKSPASVTAGFAVDETGIYYASDATLYRYNFPFVTWPSMSGSGLPPNRHGPRGLRGDQGPTGRKNLSSQP